MQLSSTFTKNKKSVNAVIETPKGCAAKYNYDAETQMFKLKKVLPGGMVFPYHFGFIPGTRAEDGDPIDVLVLMDQPAWPGCIIESTVIGVMEAEESKNGKRVRNDRIITTAVASQRYNQIKNLSSLGQSLVEEIEYFFNAYTRLEKKEFKVLSKKDADIAMNLIKKQLVNGNH